MSKKRTAAESSNDEQTAGDSDPASQQQDNAKRAKLVTSSDTTLEDLPMELLECILVKVVAMEVKDMKLAKSVWNEKSELVINRLRTVCSKWSSICTTNDFQNEVHRTLDGTVLEMVRLEIVHKYLIQFPFDFIDMTCVKDEIFILCKPNGQDYIINVLDYNNVAEVKDIIQLPGISSSSIAGCNVSNCVYVLNMELLESDADSVLRITKAEEHQFTLSPWIASDQKLSLVTASVNGNIITISKHETPNPSTVTVFTADGSLQHKVVLFPAICGLGTIANVIQRSNGNLVLFSDDLLGHAKLMEIDTSGSVVRQFQSSLREEFTVNLADIYGRILITNWQCKFELLDSEFNLLDVSPVQPNEAKVFLATKFHLNSERNEIISNYYYLDDNIDGLAIFRFV